MTSEPIAPKPRNLLQHYGDQFQDASIVAAYQHRPPHSAELLPLLLDLIPENAPRAVLDIGCGTGETARLLAPHVGRVDAIDPSEAMLAEARSLSESATNLNWIHGYFEQAPIEPPYGLAVAAESLHWTDWAVSLPKIAHALAPSALLVEVGRNVEPPPWQAELLELIPRYSTNRDFRPTNLSDELQSRGLYHAVGSWRSTSREHVQTVDAYIESIHSRNGFSRDRVTEEAAAAFDAEVRNMLRRHGHTRTVTVEAYSVALWGTPLDPSA